MTKNCFVITGMTSTQDILPMIVESSKEDETHVLIFDNFNAKRQFLEYDLNEVKSFIESTVVANKGKVQTIEVFGKEDRANFDIWYDRERPEVVYLQTVRAKGQSWYPDFRDSCLVLLAWYMDSTSDLSKFGRKIKLNVARRKKDLAFYNKEVPDWMELTESQKEKISQVKSRFYGNVRKASLDHVPFEKTQKLIDDLKDKRVCFIAEAHIRSGEIKYFEETTGGCIDALLDKLKGMGYYVVWKKREKGFPKRDHSPLEFCKKKPDLVISQDMNYPSSLFTVSNISSLNIIINTSSCVFDLLDINDNTVMILTTDKSRRENKYLDRWYGREAFGIYDFTRETGQGRFTEYLQNLEQKRPDNHGVAVEDGESKVHQIYNSIKSEIKK